MSGSREAVLGAVRRSLGRGEDGDARAGIARRMTEHPRGTVPARSACDDKALVDLFVGEATRVSATVARVDDATAVPGAVLDYLKAQNLPARLRMAPDPGLNACGWSGHPTLEITTGTARPEDAVTLTGAFAGIAETGTLMLLSGPESPTTLNFLPDAHIAVLRATDIVGPYEDAWDRLRATGRMPRTVNFITGPSRTADIEQTLQVGAHGPRRLHIVLVDDASGGNGADNG